MSNKIKKKILTRIEDQEKLLDEILKPGQYQGTLCEFCHAHLLVEGHENNCPVVRYQKLKED